ncbi:MAG TPA: hypothetical protein VGB02_16540 [Pyrinomonadaceae bacterium]
MQKILGAKCYDKIAGFENAEKKTTAKNNARRSTVRLFHVIFRGKKAA